MQKRTQHIFIFIIILILVMGGKDLSAQNLELIGSKKDVFKLNGGVSLNQLAFYTNDTISQRDPYNLYLNGNLNATLYGWSVPFTFSYSNQKATYTQPFNQYSLHPYYKWVKLHAGYTSMTFSPYTLNGHLFLGGGLELTPTDFPVQFSAMYGRLRKQVNTDSSSAALKLPELERWGYGGQMAYTLPNSDMIKANMKLNVFHSSDRTNSLATLSDSLVQPGENMVVSTMFDINLLSRFKISGEWATSAVTKNVHSAFADSSQKHWQSNLGSLFRNNATTEYFEAFKTNGAYMNDTYSLGMGYERVDPGYNSYGAYYFNNDFENITLNGSANLFDKKVNLAANIGKQRDNLDNNKASAMKRWVTAFTVNYSSGQKLDAGFSYSTFNSFMHIRPQLANLTQLTPYDNIDTLNYTQLSTSASLNISYQLSVTEKNRQNINLNASFQQSAELQNGAEAVPGSDFYNLNGSYSYSNIPINLTAVLTLNASFNNMPDMRTQTFGPTLSVNKLLFNKKLRNSFSASYNRVFNQKLPENGITSLRYNASVKLAKKHNINMGLTLMNRKKPVHNKLQNVNEFIATLGYSYNF